MYYQNMRLSFSLFAAIIAVLNLTASLNAQRRSTEPVVTLLDADRNRELSSAEMASAPESLRVADDNGDGEVTAEELAARLQYLRENRPGILQTDFPYQMAAIGAPFPDGNVAKKGMAISVGNGASMLFDMDLVRIAAGWTGGLITTTGVTFDGSHGGFPQISGKQVFGTSAVAGWADSQGTFRDDRETPFGPTDPSVARWDGYYLMGDQVVLAYTVKGTKIHEQLSSIAVGGTIGFVRSLKIAASSDARRGGMSLFLAEVDGQNGRVNSEQASLEGADGLQTHVAFLDQVDGATFSVRKEKMVLDLAPASEERLVQVVIWRGDAESESLASAFRSQGVPFVPFASGGPDRWPEPVLTRGQIAADATPDGSYVVDRLTPPLENPWNRRVRLGGFDFFSGGESAAFSTWDGDVWLLTGIDDQLERLEWKRFASGLFETLGLCIVKDEIYVSSRVGIMKLHDLNGDGTCDYYENFNNELTSSVGFHEFVFDLQTDAEGNFYFAKAGPVRGGGRGFGSEPNEGNRFGNVSAHAGTVVKVDSQGKSLQVYATGFRAPNGIGVGPQGQVTTGDNEGTWIPACPINWVREGGFYGVEDLAQRETIPNFDPPLCWLSKRDFDNSGGGQIWVSSDRWGPFEGELLHMSYGQCALYLVMKQEVGKRMQGGVVQIPVKFDSSAMRARFNERDGQLYVAGLKGWQTKAARLSGFDRVRYTGKKVYSVKDIAVGDGNIELTFTQPLNPELATDVDSYAIEQWNYQRTSNYGSREYSVADPDKQGRDNVVVRQATLSPDGRRVRLEIDELQPVMQLEIQYRLEAVDGTRLRQKTLQTIHAIPQK